jgi:hypothetical protein
MIRIVNARMKERERKYLRMITLPSLGKWYQRVVSC